MIQVAIVEDEAQERNRLRQCLDFLAEKEKVDLQVTEFASGSAFLGGYQPIFDIVLMDIEMPGMNGMETARALRKMDHAALLIFVTNLAQYAIHGYEVDAMNYILKPVNPYDFAMKMSKAISRTAKRADQSILIKTAQEMHAIRIPTVKYAEVDGHYIRYHTTEGTFSEYGTLKEAESKIGSSAFARCNRCFLVNLRYVTAVKNDSVYLGADTLQISRPQKKAFLSALTTFIGGMQ